MVRFRSSQGLTTMPPKPEVGMVIWKVNSVSGTLMKGLVDRRGVEAGLVQGGVGRGVENAEDDPLVLGGGQLLGRHA